MSSVENPVISEWRTLRAMQVHTRVARSARSASPTVILVHGFGVSSRYFVPTLELLGQHGFDAHAPDLPGHGLSDTPAHAFTLDEQSAFLLDWLAAEGHSAVSIVANSMGCPIAVRAALRDAGRIRRLVLIGPTLDPAARGLLPVFLRFLRAIPFERLSLAPLLLRDYARMNLRLWPEFKGMLADRLEDYLPRVDQPVLLVRGEHDPIAPLAWLEALAAQLGALHRIEVVPRVGHAVNYSAADALVRVMAPFLREN